MNQLDRFPSLQTFGEQLDELAERDAHRWMRPNPARRLARLWPGSRPHVHLAARLALSLGAIAAVAGGTYAVPVTRAAVDDVYGTLSSWISGDEAAAPGRPVSAGEDVPSWVSAEDGEKRVLAQAGGEKLVAIRQGDKLTLALAGFGETDTIDGWRRRLSGQRIDLVGPGRFLPNGRHDLRPLFGLVSSTVTRIRFNYADDGPPVTADRLTGAFGIVIETNRRPSSLTGYDQAGNLVARFDFTADPQDLVPGKAGQALGDFRYCPDAAHACPPWPR
ncbi:MAG TPA: hypothetical protein VK501_03355 [Baekduia sp.]|uniref:hypothetical protein n=1 Tax=Baekduia sp. TaxID=2600305 RepID=UPI002CAC0A30|nr:hypothetical protein [Baekduia sp.]HMJ32931.1 hypothetical protein [Baekduia sp.]